MYEVLTIMYLKLLLLGRNISLCIVEIKLIQKFLLFAKIALLEALLSESNIAAFDCT